MLSVQHHIFAFAMAEHTREIDRAIWQDRIFCLNGRFQHGIVGESGRGPRQYERTVFAERHDAVERREPTLFVSAGEQNIKNVYRITLHARQEANPVRQLRKDF